MIYSKKRSSCWIMCAPAAPTPRRKKFIPAPGAKCGCKPCDGLPQPEPACGYGQLKRVTMPSAPDRFERQYCPAHACGLHLLRPHSGHSGRGDLRPPQHRGRAYGMEITGMTLFSMVFAAHAAQIINKNKI